MNGVFTCGDVILRVGRTDAPAGVAVELADVLAADGDPGTGTRIRPGCGDRRPDRDGVGSARADGRRPSTWEAVGRVVAVSTSSRR